MWIQPPNNWNFIPEMMEGINLMRGKARNGYPPRVSDGEGPRRFEDV